MVTLRVMILGELLRQHGIASAAELGRRLNIARQHAWLLWTGRHLPSYEILQRLATDLNIDPQALAQLERAKLPKDGRRRKGRTQRRPRDE
jgi:transcriptional regulator with XRE-family HTH domain